MIEQSLSVLVGCVAAPDPDAAKAHLRGVPACRVQLSLPQFCEMVRAQEAHDAGEQAWLGLCPSCGERNFWIFRVFDA
jgi:hypothetical protein